VKRHRVGKSKKRHTLAKVPGSFKSHGGRTFYVGRGEHQERFPGDTSWSDTFPILLDGKEVGSITQGDGYGLTKDGKRRWTGSLNKLRWAGALPPTGLGFDVSAFDSPEEVLQAWGRNADQVLNWREGKMTPEDTRQENMYVWGKENRRARGLT
jgi:hypothetical protein